MTFLLYGKEVITILAYKKDSNYDPSNFRPINLQPAFSKNFIPTFRNRLHDFCYKNKYIESILQKDLEHIETLTHISNHPRKKQRRLIITLLDLKNVFGEVSHYLLISVLNYRHMSDHIIYLLKSLYTDYKLAIVNDCK